MIYWKFNKELFQKKVLIKLIKKTVEINFLFKQVSFLLLNASENEESFVSFSFLLRSVTGDFD